MLVNLFNSALTRGKTLARGLPMDEVGSMPISSIKIERACHFRLMQSVGLRGAARR